MIDRLNAALEGRYHIERELGEGGMATVYLADDLKHERKVAIKVLRPELAAVVGAERFLAEIKTTANLQHPHILPLFDSGEADSFLFYVMPYVEGESLGDRLQRERQLPVDEAVRIAREVADALDYAHRQGVVHRDVKPANVLLHEGRPLVADFGIALAVSQAGAGRITETGLSLGTPHYMSPEQAAGERDVDPRSDVYALGCVLYEMLTGEPPYGGGTAQSVLAKILTEEPRRVTQIRRTVPRHVDAVVAKSLEKLPADRFESAAAFRDGLEDEGFRHQTAGAPRETAPVASEDAAAPPARGRTVLVGVAAAVVAAAAFVAGRGSAPAPARAVARFQFGAPEGVVPVGRCCGPSEALSPDGEWFVFVGIESGDPSLYRRRLGQLEAEAIPGTEGASIPFFSPDSRWVGFYSDGRLRKVPMGGGPAVPIADANQVNGASWGDNDVIVFAGADSLYTVPAAGGVPKVVGAPESGSYIHPWMLPGGESALVRIAGPGADEDARVAAVDLESGEADTLGFGTRAAYGAGYLVMSGADGTLLAQPFDPRKRRTTGPAVAILDQVGTAGPSMGEFGLSAHGDLAYKAGGAYGAESLTLRGQGGPVEIPLTEGGNLEDPSFSPDGRKIAVSVLAVESTPQIWIWDRDQQTQQLLTVEGRNRAPVWSPDGSRIAFRSQRDEAPPQIYWQPADGSGRAEILLETKGGAMPGGFSPDGGSLVFTAQRENARGDIGLLDLSGGTVRWLVDSDADESQPEISPDGRWLAYASDRSGQTEVYVRALDGTGGRTQISAGGGNSPRWAPDGNTLYFATEEGAPVMAASVSTQGGFRVVGREQAFTGPADLNVGGPITWDVSPDGGEFLYISRGGGARTPSFVWILDWPEIARGMQAGEATR